MPRRKDKAVAAISESDVDKYKMLFGLLSSLYSDVQDLARKKQDGHLSKIRIGMVNRLLIEIKSLIANEPTVAFLDTLDEDTIPQNADALIILGQHMAALRQFKMKYSTNTYGTTHWVTGQKDEESDA
jgi:hypothetical protein